MTIDQLTQRAAEKRAFEASLTDGEHFVALVKGALKAFTTESAARSARDEYTRTTRLTVHAGSVTTRQELRS